MCNEDGTRVIDWLGLVFVFLGIGLTGIGNSLFYRYEYTQYSRRQIAIEVMILKLLAFN